MDLSGIKREISKMKFPKVIDNDRAEGTGALVEIAIGVTILMIVLAYIFAPVGLVAFQGTNLTAAGLTAGTAGLSIWNAIVPVTMAVLILALVSLIRKGKN